MLPGEPSSQEVENRMVGPRMRMARYPAHVISERRMRCLSVNLRQGASGLEGAGDATAFTPLFYRYTSNSPGSLQSANYLVAPEGQLFRRGRGVDLRSGLVVTEKQLARVGHAFDEDAAAIFFLHHDGHPVADLIPRAAISEEVITDMRHNLFVFEPAVQNVEKELIYVAELACPELHVLAPADAIRFGFASQRMDVG